MTDPMEAIVAKALSAGGYEFTTDKGGGNKTGLDFHLTGPDVHIEVKRFHSDRIAAQLARVDNAIALQGEVAVRFFAGLVEAAQTVRAPLASTAVTDDIVALGVAGIQRRDAEGWSDEDEDQINRELAKAVLIAVLELPESTSDVVRRIVPAGHTCGPVIVGETEFADLEAAIAREKAALAAKLPTDQDAIAQINEAVRRLQDLGWKDPVHCPKDGSTFDGIEVGSTGIHPYLYLGTWPDGAFWLQADGDLWPSRPILGRPVGGSDDHG